jgi:heptosyltransferase-2
MKILIETPTWLGDSVMISPAIENLVNYYNNPEITLIGGYASIELFCNHPSVVKTYVLKKEYKSLNKFAKKLGYFDVIFSFRGSLRSAVLQLMISSSKKYQYKKKRYPGRHQVDKYNDFINESLKINSTSGFLKLYQKSKPISKKSKPVLGINPGAAYGDAKQWYPREFAKVIVNLHDKYDTIIFGGLLEVDVANDIEKLLLDYNISNYENLAGRTSISDLVDRISEVDLFITGDSGPMHIAASFQVPTIAIFGPTNDNETSQWMNANSSILKKNLECQPCMKRTCPLKHHNCMSLIKSKDVLLALESIN